MAGVDDSDRIRRVVLDLTRRLFRSRRQAIIAVAGEDSLRRIELKMASVHFDRGRVLREAIVEEHARIHSVTLSREAWTTRLSFAGPSPVTSGVLSVRPDGVEGHLASGDGGTPEVMALLGLHDGGTPPLARASARALEAGLAEHGLAQPSEAERCLSLEIERIERAGLATIRSLVRRLYAHVDPGTVDATETPPCQR